MRLFTLLLLLGLAAAPAQATHEGRHSEDYCTGLLTLAEQIAFAKEFQVTQAGVVAYVRRVGAQHKATPEAVALWVKDAEAIYAAADYGRAHIMACFEAAQQPNPKSM